MLVGQSLLGEPVESGDLGLGCAVDQEAEGVVHGDRIVDPLPLHIGLSHDDHGSTRLGVEQRFHGGRGGRLVLGHVAPVEIARGEDLEQRRNQPGDHAAANEDSSALVVASAEDVERAHGRHHEGAGDYGPAHGVDVLEPGPVVRQDAPKAGHLE
jgi:hypothetical protein